MVAKVQGLARFATAIAALNSEGDDMASALEQLLARKEVSKSAFLNAVAGANAAFDSLDALTAAFGGNGAPPLSDAKTAPAPAAPANPQ